MSTNPIEEVGTAANMLGDIIRKYHSKRQVLLDELELLDAKLELSCRIVTGVLGPGEPIKIPYENVHGVGGGSHTYVNRQVWRIDDILAMTADMELYVKYSVGDWDTYRTSARLGNVTVTTRRLRTFLGT